MFPTNSQVMLLVGGLILETTDREKNHPELHHVFLFSVIQCLRAVSSLILKAQILDLE